jgi:hypothetical protein
MPGPWPEGAVIIDGKGIGARRDGVCRLQSEPGEGNRYGSSPLLAVPRSMCLIASRCPGRRCVTAAARGSQAGADDQLVAFAATIRQVVLRGRVPPGLPACVVDEPHEVDRAPPAGHDDAPCGGDARGSVRRHRGGLPAGGRGRLPGHDGRRAAAGEPGGVGGRRAVGSDPRAGQPAAVRLERVRAADPRRRAGRGGLPGRPDPGQVDHHPAGAAAGLVSEPRAEEEAAISRRPARPRVPRGRRARR